LLWDKSLTLKKSTERIRMGSLLARITILESLLKQIAMLLTSGPRFSPPIIARQAKDMTALLLVFVDVLKELPATLILRPLDYNTLAVRAYELASDEQLADASHASLSIVAVGILPVILLSGSITRSRHAKPT
jgi:hypothetical protein